MAENSTYYQLSLNILKALGGDVSIAYPDADAIWDEIYKIYDHAGGRFDIVPLEKTITANGTYDYYPDGDADAFMPVNLKINVPQKYTDKQVADIENAAKKQGYNDGYAVGEAEGRLIGQEEGYQEGYVEGIEIQRDKLTTITITENGVYTKQDGYKEVTVQVENTGGITDEELQEMLKDAMDEGYQDGYAEGVDDGIEEGYQDGYNEGELHGIVIQKDKLTSLSVSENGTYTREDGYNEVIVDIPPKGIPEEDVQMLVEEAHTVGIETGKLQQKELMESITLKENGTYTREDGWNSVTVQVAGTGGEDSGKPKIYNGFRILKNSSALSIIDTLSKNLALVDFTQYDWSDVYDLEEFFGGFRISNGDQSYEWSDTDFDNFREGFNGEILSCKNMFKYATGSKNNAPLKVVPDFSKFTNNLLITSYAFADCVNLLTAVNITKWNTSKVVDMSYMFSGCSKLTTVPEFDCSAVRNVDGMFYSCSKLTTVPNMNCYNLRTFNYSGTTWLQTTSSVKSIGELRCDSIADVRTIFGSTTNNNITYFGGAKNLGKMYNVSNTAGTNAFVYAPNLTHESVMNIINGLYDRASVGYPILELKLHANHLALLSDEEKAIATNKGWTLS